MFPTFTCHPKGHLCRHWSFCACQNLISVFHSLWPLLFPCNLRYLGLFLQSLPALIERAEGFSQALTWQPTLELCKLRQEVFAGCKAKEENNIQNFVSPGEMTPTDAEISKNSCVVLKRKKAVGSPERRRYPLRRRKITPSAWISHLVFSDWKLSCTLIQCAQSFFLNLCLPSNSVLYTGPSLIPWSLILYFYCYTDDIWKSVPTSSI